MALYKNSNECIQTHNLLHPCIFKQIFRFDDLTNKEGKKENTVMRREMMAFIKSSVSLHEKLNLAFDILKYCGKGWPRKSNIFNTSKECQLYCWYWVAIMKAQPNQWCIRILSKSTSLFSKADARKQNSSISNRS